MSYAKKVIYTKKAPQPIGAYSQAIAVSQSEKVIYLSGQIPLSPETGQLIGENFITQAKQVFSNINAVLSAAGSSFTDLVKLNVYLIDISHTPILNQVMQEIFHDTFPARSTVQVCQLPANALIEVDAIALTRCSD